jgi:Holliday junction resolvase RusA-like endonuclease
VEWNEGALKQLAMQKIPVINYPIRMELEVTLGSWRRKDGDGIICSIFDTLQDGGYIADDTLFHIPEHVVRLVGYEKGKESNLIKITKAELPIAIREYLNTK